jgi:shikimate dehydrogenase
MVVCDLIYHRLTPLAAAAVRRGLKTIDGLGMLIYQGALSFEMWTGCQAPVPAMFAAARAALAG